MPGKIVICEGETDNRFFECEHQHKHGSVDCDKFHNDKNDLSEMDRIRQSLISDFNYLSNRKEGFRKSSKHPLTCVLMFAIEISTCSLW